MKIHQITDLHIPEDGAAANFAHVKGNVQRQIAFVADDDSDLLVISGDLTMTDGSSSACQWLKENLPDSLKTIIMPGNHDDPAVLWEIFGAQRCVNESFHFSFEHDDLQYIFVNTTTDSLPENQLEFLASEGAKKPSLLFIHHPPDLVSKDGFMALNQPLINHAEVAEVIRASQISDVFCGHYHNSADIDCGGFQLHVTSSPAFQIDLNTAEFTTQPFEPGVRMIETEGLKLRTRIVYV